MFDFAKNWWWPNRKYLGRRVINSEYRELGVGLVVEDSKHRGYVYVIWPHLREMKLFSSIKSLTILPIVKLNGERILSSEV